MLALHASSLHRGTAVDQICFYSDSGAAVHGAPRVCAWKKMKMQPALADDFALEVPRWNQYLTDWQGWEHYHLWKSMAMRWNKSTATPMRTSDEELESRGYFQKMLGCAEGSEQRCAARRQRGRLRGSARVDESNSSTRQRTAKPRSRTVEQGLRNLRTLGFGHQGRDRRRHSRRDPFFFHHGRRSNAMDTT